MLREPWFLFSVGAIAAFGACTAVKRQSLSGGTHGAAASGAGGGAGHAASGTGTGGGLNLAAATGSGGNSGNGCDAGPDEDKDKDGFSINQGDCNDCDPNVNPNAVEVDCADQGQGGGGGMACMPTDQDCDGKIDKQPVLCDQNLAIDSNDPYDAAKAIELCRKSAGKFSNGIVKWGITSAQWTALDGSQDNVQSPNYPLGHGILSGFGPNVKVQAGKHMLGLSSGSARQPTDPGYHDVSGFDKGYTTGSYPPGQFPKEFPACPGVVTGNPHDFVSLMLKIRTPSNAHGFKFQFNFYTYEWPDWVCTQYNDFFVTMLTPKPMNLVDGNIVFDKQKNPVSVNNAFVEVCGCDGNPPNPCMTHGKTFPCPLGDMALMGTGFGKDTAFQDHASTSWLETQAPVGPNQDITVQFAVWDSGDGILDTSALIDNWQWIAKPGTTVDTNPVPNPM